MRPDQPPNQTSVSHETPGANVRAIAWWLVGLVLLVLTTGGLMRLLITHFADVAPRVAAGPNMQQFPRPQQSPPLNPDLSQELLQTRALARHLLNSYAWQDRQRQVARIPIHRAMDILSQSGLPNVGATPQEER